MTPVASSAEGPSTRRLPPWPLLAVLSGLLVGCSQPIVIASLGGKLPLDGSGWSGLLALFGLVPALVAIEGQGPRRAYAVGFVTWLVAFGVIVQWIITTIHVYAGAPLVVAALVLALLTSAMAAYVAAAFAVARVVARFLGVRTWLVLPPALAGVELLRNFGPVGGFPWGSLGHSFATVPALLQLASVIGVTGLTFVAAVVNAALADVVHAWWHRSGERLDKRAVVLALAVVVGWATFGAVRLRDDVTRGPALKIALLQPNVNEGLADLTRESPRALLERFHALEQRALEQGVDMILWPEGSFPNRGLRRDLKDLKKVELLPEGATPPPASIVGASVVGRIPGDDGKPRNIRQNSAFVVDGDLVVRGRFDKTHLVPFGEYVPWPFGAFVRQFIPLGTTTPGTALRPIDVDVKGNRVGVGITVCYEGVFPEISRALAKNGATMLANLTDDRWYGVSGMATQHLLMYALRAVETGRPVARATNTGISAWVDVHGGIHGRTGMYEEALLVDDMATRTIDTVYLALGDWVAGLALLFTLLAWFAAMLDGRAFFARPRPPTTLALGALGLVATVGGLAWWLTGSGLDEARSTQALLSTIAGLLVGIGALSQRSWGRRAVLVVGALAVVFGVVATVIAGANQFVLVVVGVVVVVLGRRHIASRDAAVALAASAA
jgi:apolipoprotein N-acyltransferase